MNIFKQYLKNFDLPLFISVIILSIIGIVLVSSATASFSNAKTIMAIQIGATILGIILCIGVVFLDYEVLAEHYKYIIGFNIIILVLVLFIGTGETIGGKSWIRFGPVGIQPAEIAKIGFIIAFAFQLDKYKERLNNILVVLGCLLHVGVLVFLIMRQPDFGTTMVFIAVFAAMMFAAKISYTYIIAALLSIPPIFAYLWFFAFQEYQKKRILDFLNPEMNTQYSGYQVIQSKTAIGSGKIFGQGLFKGILTQNNLLPAKHTDFIFAVAGEELGFIGAILIVLLIVFIVIRCFIIAYNSKDTLGTLIALGVGIMILVQSFENIGMTIGITPVTGITLPFLSYGGSSMLTNFIAIGLVLNVKLCNKRLNFS